MVIPQMEGPDVIIPFTYSEGNHVIPNEMPTEGTKIPSPFMTSLAKRGGTHLTVPPSHLISLSMTMLFPSIETPLGTGWTLLPSSAGWNTCVSLMKISYTRPWQLPHNWLPLSHHTACRPSGSTKNAACLPLECAVFRTFYAWIPFLLTANQLEASTMCSFLSSRGGG